MNPYKEVQRTLTLKGFFGVVSDTPNRNGRIYTEETYLPHIKDIRDRLSRGETIYGELDHLMIDLRLR